MASRRLRPFTTDEMGDILVRLKRMESTTSIATPYGCSWKSISRLVKAAFPQMYAAVATWRKAHGQKRGGKGRAAQRPPRQQGQGYQMYLYGSGVQPSPFRDREAPRWPVRTMEEFTSVEIAEITTRLLARQRTP